MFQVHVGGSGAAAVRAKAEKKRQKAERRAAAKAGGGGHITPERATRARVVWVWNRALLDPAHMVVDGATATKKELGMREVTERGGGAPPKVSTALGPMLPDDELDANARSHAHYFEVELLDDNNDGSVRATVGLAVNGCSCFAGDASLTPHAIGFNTFTGAFHSGRRRLARAAPRVSASGPASTMVAPGDRVGIYYDGRDDTVTFFLNGVQLSGGAFRVFALPLGQAAPVPDAAALRAGGAAARAYQTGVPPPHAAGRSLAQRHHDTARRRREGPGVGASATLDGVPCEVHLETVWDRSLAAEDDSGGGAGGAATGNTAPMSRRASKPPTSMLRPFVSLRGGTAARLVGGAPGSAAAPPFPAGAKAVSVTHLPTKLQANAATRGFMFEVRAKVAALRITAVWFATRDGNPALVAHGGVGAHRVTVYAVDQGSWGGKGEDDEAFADPSRWRAVGSAEVGFDAASGASPDGVHAQVRIGLRSPGVRVERGATQALYLHCPGSASAVGYNVTPTFGNTNASNDYIAIQVGTMTTGVEPFEGCKYPKLGSLAGSVEYEVAENDDPAKSV